MSSQKVQQLQQKLALQEKKIDLIMAIDHIRDNTPEPTAMMTAIVNLLSKMLQTDFCLLFLTNQETREIELKALNDFSDKFNQLDQQAIQRLAQQTVQLNQITQWFGQEILPHTLLTPFHFAAVPIIMGEHERLGALLLARSTKPFSKDELDLLKVAEDHIDSAIIQIQVYHQLQQNLKELATIYRIDQIRDRGLPFDEMLNVVLQELGQTLQIEIGFIMLYDRTGKRLEMRAATDNDLLKISTAYQTITQLAQESLKKGHLLCRNHLPPPLNAIMALPLVFNNQIIGVLGVANHLQRDNFSQDDQNLLHAIGSQIDTAIFESLERRHLRRVLGRSVDPRIMERLLTESDDQFLKGERTVLTVLYADLRGSTHLAESIAPELLVEFINDYLGQMTHIILTHEGTLDKFVGDQVMALFGAPYPQPDHALQAIRVGLAMQKGHQALLETWYPHGINNVPIGIGLATGELIVGEMGSSERTDYTVIGRAANLGARICNVARGGQVLISQQTYDLTRNHIEVRPIPGLRFKGVAEEVTVYEVIACDE